MRKYEAHLAKPGGANNSINPPPPDPGESWVMSPRPGRARGYLPGVQVSPAPARTASPTLRHYAWRCPMPPAGPAGRRLAEPVRSAPRPPDRPTDPSK